MHNIPFWKVLLSWIYPLKIETFESKKNTILEVNLQYGQLVVDTKNANYSFGNLHYVFQEAIDSLNLSTQKKYDVLILGYGAGSIEEILINKNINHNTIAVEYDYTIIDIANKHFPDIINKVNIEIEDAKKFIENNDKTFDLIFVDLFIDTNVPKKFQQKDFLDNIKKALSKDGIVLMNSMNNTNLLYKNWQNTFKELNKLEIQENKVLLYKNY